MYVFDHIFLSRLSLSSVFSKCQSLESDLSSKMKCDQKANFMFMNLVTLKWSVTKFLI